MEQELIKKFGELFVHTEKLYGKGKNRVDFFVYAQNRDSLKLYEICLSIHPQLIRKFVEIRFSEFEKIVTKCVKT